MLTAMIYAIQQVTKAYCKRRVRTKRVGTYTMLVDRWKENQTKRPSDTPRSDKKQQQQQKNKNKNSR